MEKRFYNNEVSSNTHNIAIVTSPLPLHNKVGEILFQKLLNIMLGSKIGKVYSISGNIPKSFFEKDRHMILENVDYDTRGDHIFIKVFKYIVMQLKFSRAIIKNREKIDTVFFWISSALVFPMIIAKLLRKKTLIIATGRVSASCKYLKIFELINFHLADVIGVESKGVIEYIDLQKFGKKILIFHLYLTNKFNIIAPLKDRENIIGYIGRFSKEKGILEFLDAIGILKNNNMNFKILIGGAGPLKQKVEEYVAKLSNLIYFLDWIPPEKIIETLNSLKLLVIPSYSEGLPNMLLEAMACGTPVLATPVGGIPDLIKDEKTGFLMKNNSPKFIAKNIMRALNNSNLERISVNERNIIVGEYTYKSAIEKFEEMIRFLYGNK